VARLLKNPHSDGPPPPRYFCASVRYAWVSTQRFVFVMNQPTRLLQKRVSKPDRQCKPADPSEGVGHPKRQSLPPKNSPRLGAVNRPKSRSVVHPPEGGLSLGVTTFSDRARAQWRKGKIRGTAFELRATGMSVGSGGLNFWREPAMRRRPLMQGQVAPQFILNQAYIYFIASVKPLALGDGQLFSEMASATRKEWRQSGRLI
jgi:hypothetical protein